MGVAYQRKDDETYDDAWASKRDKLADWLRKQIDCGGGYLELQRMQGRSSYDSTGHTWIVEDEGIDVDDADGNPITTGGVDPLSLADDVILRSREHCAEKGSRTHYRVVAFVHQADGTLHQLPGPFTVSAQLFDEPSVAPPTSAREESQGEVLRVMELLLRQNKDLHGYNMKLIEQYPRAMEKLADTVGRVADQASESDTSLDKVLAVLRFQREEKRDDIDLERYRIDSQRRRDLFTKAVDVFGPGIILAVREMMSRLGVSPEDIGVDLPGGSMAERLDEALGQVPAEGLRKARTILGDDAWTVVEAARKAESDAVFRAQVAKLQEILGRVPKQEQARVMVELGNALGERATLVLAQLLQEVERG